MPFLLIPIFWHFLTNSFHQQEKPRERAHGDGMLVSADSPEAFEEIIWRQFWPSRYKEQKIEPRFEGKYAEFEKFFIHHIRKVIYLGKRDRNEAKRYVSKNNLNISRLVYISALFTDAKILVPFREPLQHASSLLKQHRNFLDIHQRDHFARTYMRAIGHYDFGENLSPVNFNGWLSKSANFDPLTLDFWLSYWTNAYDYLLRMKNDCIHFLSFDEFCQNPAKKLIALSEYLGINDRQGFIASASQVKSPKPYYVDRTSIDKEILDKAEQLYQQLVRDPFFSPGIEN
ncbi:sulfotransferase domain-containing protein, partial [candidate division KSB1 bacterium]|nr:sulfotransferase domain-containing protein [candidate division KSB1 bacterium]RQW07410.1 MAG: hypothetical protein EH222_07415 [candidate division KSB1 bacterium]